MKLSKRKGDKMKEARLKLFNHLKGSDIDAPLWKCGSIGLLECKRDSGRSEKNGSDK